MVSRRSVATAEPNELPKLTHIVGSSASDLYSFGVRAMI